MQNIRKMKAVRGFTLIELVIVIAVIAILAALLVPTILGQADRARYSRAKGDVQTIAKMVARVRNDTANTTSTCLTVLTNLASSTSPLACGTTINVPVCNSVSPDKTCWGGPYLLSVANDPWNNPYVATEDPATNAITVHSNGPDTTSGGADDLTNIQ